MFPTCPDRAPLRRALGFAVWLCRVGPTRAPGRRIAHLEEASGDVVRQIDAVVGGVHARQHQPEVSVLVLDLVQVGHAVPAVVQWYSGTVLQCYSGTVAQRGAVNWGGAGKTPEGVPNLLQQKRLLDITQGAVWYIEATTDTEQYSSRAGDGKTPEGVPD
eukprot:1360436-Pyramimonas_sp.AAC.1